MKNLKVIFIASALLSLGSYTQAQTEVPNTFEAGAAATAASVNANFSALITAIDNLGTRVTALEAPSGNVTIDDLVGSTYCVSFFGNIGDSRDGSSAAIGSYIGAARLAITSTTLSSLTVQLDKEFELEWYVDGAVPSTLVSNVNIGDLVNGPTISGDDPDGAGPFAGTITSFTGGLLTLNLGGDVETFTVSADGNMILNSNFDAAEGETNLIVGMRCI